VIWPADRRRLATIRFAETGAKHELDAIGGAQPQGAEHAGVFAASPADDRSPSLRRPARVSA
jgi:hypothetical protein